MKIDELEHFQQYRISKVKLPKRDKPAKGISEGEVIIALVPRVDVGEHSPSEFVGLLCTDKRYYHMPTKGRFLKAFEFEPV